MRVTVPSELVFCKGYSLIKLTSNQGYSSMRASLPHRKIFHHIEFPSGLLFHHNYSSIRVSLLLGLVFHRARPSTRGLFQCTANTGGHTHHQTPLSTITVKTCHQPLSPPHLPLPPPHCPPPSRRSPPPDSSVLQRWRQRPGEVA